MTEQQWEAVERMIRGLTDDQVKETRETFENRHVDKGKMLSLAEDVRQYFQRRGWSRAEAEEMTGLLFEKNPDGWKKMVDA
jgi:hypothetical protein